MRRTAAILIVLVLLFLSGCSNNKETPAIDYTTDVSISKEAPPDNLTWYVFLRAPTEGKSILEFSSYKAFTTLDSVKIQQTEKRDYCSILEAKAHFNYTFIDKISAFYLRYADKEYKYTLKVFGMNSKEFEQKIGKYIDLDSLNYYEDRAFGIFYPYNYEGETEKSDTEYANRIILVDYNYENSVVLSYTEDELKAKSNGLHSKGFSGRIGDRYYLTNGYYDFTDRKLYPYKDESDLPPIEESLGIKDKYDLFRLIEHDPVASQFIPDYHYIESYARIKDRYYVVIANFNRYYGDSIDDYEGENVFIVTVDAVTGNVLYLQKFHIKNYWGYSYKLCSRGEDGILYDVMTP